MSEIKLFYHGTQAIFLDNILIRGLHPPVYFTDVFDVAARFSAGKALQLQSLNGVAENLEYIVLQFEGDGLDFQVDKFRGLVIGSKETAELIAFWKKWEKHLFVTREIVPPSRFRRLITNVGEFSLI